MTNKTDGTEKREWLTRELAEEYRTKATQLPDNGGQDIGRRRMLRMELQQRCGLTENEAVNILNGYHIENYVNKYYRLQNGIALEKDPKKNKNLINIEALEELERLKALVREDYSIPGEENDL